MSLPNTLPRTQGEYAVTAFKQGEVIHNGDILTAIPSRKGYHAIFYPKGLNAHYVGPFETQNEAYSVGLSFADFGGIMQIL